MTTKQRTAKRSARNARPSRPRPDIETYQIGNWSGVPNYGCPFCDFATLAGTADVVAHIASNHRTQAAQEA